MPVSFADDWSLACLATQDSEEFGWSAGHIVRWHLDDIGLRYQGALLDTDLDLYILSLLKELGPAWSKGYNGIKRLAEKYQREFVEPNRTPKAYDLRPFQLACQNVIIGLAALRQEVSIDGEAAPYWLTCEAPHVATYEGARTLSALMLCDAFQSGGTMEASTEHRRAKDALDTELAAASANDDLIRLWAEAANLQAAKDSTQATLTELLEGTVAPLAAEISQRWTSLFPDRGAITTTPAGQITRTLNGIGLPYEAFSAGESMGAILLLRLLVVQMATNASFCWFDEPLEHLDPDTRRDVANLLSRVTNTNGPLKQVVVTTYEDQLARRLQDRDPDHVRLVYVRQSPARKATHGG
jgi:hypothetical protein